MYIRNLNFLYENEVPYLMRFEPFYRKINASSIFPSYRGRGGGGGVRNWVYLKAAADNKFDISTLRNLQF